MKCSKVGCGKEAIRHSLVNMGGMVADVWGCEEHYKEIMESLKA